MGSRRDCEGSSQCTRTSPDPGYGGGGYHSDGDRRLPPDAQLWCRALKRCLTPFNVTNIHRAWLLRLRPVLCLRRSEAVRAFSQGRMQPIQSTCILCPRYARYRGSMLRGLGPIRIVSFLLFTTCVALCQSDLLHHNTSELPISERSLLPDAPSPTPPQASRSEECRSLAMAREFLSCYGFGPRIPQETEQASVPAQLASIASPAAVPKESEASTFLVRYLSPPSLKQDTTHYVPASNSVMGRTLSAVSPVLITHDICGRARPNTAYFLQVLTSAFVHTAYRPVSARSASATFDGFRSTISSDAGGQVFHEFEPDLLQVVKHLKFISRIEQHVVPHSQASVR